MAVGENPPPRDAFSFGAFRLVTAERLLEKAGAPINIGGRALDILLILVERAGEVVSKQELIALVWPDVTVDDGSLRAHIVAVRKALGDGQEGARYVTNVPGRGYCFVAPVSRLNAPKSIVVESPDLSNKLPARLMRMVGRDETTQEISAQLAAQRFVTIVGPGGIGKTTVAVSIAHTLHADFDGAVLFVDLAPLADPLLVPGVLASMLGLAVHSNDPIPTLLAFLRDKRMLLVLDSCEHVIDTVAALAEAIFKEAPQVHLLATSRESLRVEGEHIYRLPPLGSPPDDLGLKAEGALAFAAVQLFVERVAAGSTRFELSDADAPIVAEICRRLDGMALAIELAAGRVEAYGIQGTSTLLNDRFRLVWRGRRTALPRHRTLSAMLDWSYNLLSEAERLILRRLAIFVGNFSLEAAQAVAAGDDIDEAQFIEVVAGLVAKSLAAADTDAGMTRYRLLDTTRAYVRAKLLDNGELDTIARRHAIYYCDLLDRAGPESPVSARNENLAQYAEHLGNVRRALEWSFSQQGDVGVGTALAAAAAPLLLEMSLLTECHRWTEQAIAALDDAVRGTRREMELQASLGKSLMFTKGNSEGVRIAFTRSLQLAEDLDYRNYQLQLLVALHLFHERIGDFRSALTFAQRSLNVAKDIGDPVGIAAAHSMLGIAYHLIGDHPEAQTHIEAALVPVPISRLADNVQFGFDFRNRARIASARNFWVNGHPDTAARTARQTVDEAETLEHPVTLCIALIWAVSVYLWIGDWESADENIERFIAHAKRHSLAPYHAVGRGVKAELSVRHGEAHAGVQTLRACLETLHIDRYELLTAAFISALAEGLAMTGRFDLALTAIDEAIVQVESNGDFFNMPELLRIKGQILTSGPSSDLPKAEDCFVLSLDWARKQSALSWELRTAVSLAQLYCKQDRVHEARAMLAPIYTRFTEGFETLDLKAAKMLLDELRE